MPKTIAEIYLDNASATPVDPEVLKTMLPYFAKEYGNPSSHHAKGLNAKIAIDKAREIVAKDLNCKESGIIFTNGATQSNNMAILGIAKTNKGKHLITSKIEHESVLKPFEELEKEGFKITYLPVNKEGLINLRNLENAIQKDTILISIMAANNEIGTIQPLEKIGAICKKHNVIFHTDACQIINFQKIDVKKYNIDLLTLNSGKIYGPKGIGVLYKKDAVKIKPIIFGGGQEKNLHSGTENVPLIVGLGKALEITAKKREEENARLSKLKNIIIKEFTKNPKIHINSPLKNCLPNNINIAIEKIDREKLLLQLDEEKIYVSIGSACSSGEHALSHVLKAIGLPEKLIYQSIRISPGRFTTKKDIERFLTMFRKLI